MRIKPNKLIKLAYKENKRSSLLIYLILRLLIILCMVLEIIRGDLNNALLCLLSLILLFAPLFIQSKFKITIPNMMEIFIYLFIFSAEILGEINNFYGIIPFWDTLLHTINGFLAAAVGFSIVDLLNKNSKKFNLSPLYLSFVAFCFSMTIGVVWEFFEYGMDKVFLMDMQKDSIVRTVSTVSLNDEKLNKVVVVKDIDKTILYDKNNNELAIINNGYLDIGISDTIADLFVNFIGAFVFSIIGYYNLKRNNKKFINNFVPINKQRTMPKSVKKVIDDYNL